MDELALPRSQLLAALGVIGEALQKSRRQFKDIKIGDRNWPVAISMLPRALDGNRTLDAKKFGAEFEADAKKLNRHLATIAGSQGPGKGDAMIAAIDEGMRMVEALEKRL
jgi:hypothetical protein